VSEKFANVRRWGQCGKCHKFRELRVGFNESMSEIISVCDGCFNCPEIDSETFDLLYEKAGVDGPARTLTIPVAEFIQQLPPRHWELERIFPEED
jgi:hypothetical protein